MDYDITIMFGEPKPLSGQWMVWKVPVFTSVRASSMRKNKLMDPRSWREPQREEFSTPASDLVFHCTGDAEALQVF